MKKILSAFLVIALLISLTAAVSAASGKTYFLVFSCFELASIAVFSAVNSKFHSVNQN